MPDFVLDSSFCRESPRNFMPADVRRMSNAAPAAGVVLPASWKAFLISFSLVAIATHLLSGENFMYPGKMTGGRFMTPLVSTVPGLAARNFSLVVVHG